MGFIYKLTLKKESRKAYIGQTIRDIHKRLEEHQQSSSKCRAISAAIQKHGWENFDKEWYEVPDEDLNFYEEMLVALLGTLAPGGYNLMEGGSSAGKRSEETKQKMREAKSGEKNYNYGKTLSEESKQKNREAHIGMTHTDETKQKLKEANSGEKNPMYGKTGEKHPKFGKEHTEETKKKQSEANSGEKNHASKKVYQYTIDGTYVDEYDSSGEATRALGKTYGTNISACARGDCKTAYGFKWSREKL